MHTTTARHRATLDRRTATRRAFTSIEPFFAIAVLGITLTGISVASINQMRIVEKLEHRTFVVAPQGSEIIATYHENSALPWFSFTQDRMLNLSSPGSSAEFQSIFDYWSRFHRGQVTNIILVKPANTANPELAISTPHRPANNPFNNVPSLKSGTIPIGMFLHITSSRLRIKKYPGSTSEVHVQVTP